MTNVESSDDNVGSSLNTSSSLSSFLSTLVPVALQAGAFVLLFLLLRGGYKRIYAPRTYLGTVPEKERSPLLPKGFINWITHFWSVPDTFILNHQSLDGYLFIRFLKIIVVICFVGCCITWPILFPINATGNAGQTQLDVLSFSNIDKSTQKNRYYAHVFVAWTFMSFVMFMITRESLFYINLRQAYLLSPLYASRLSSRTVLFTSVPDEYMNEAKIRGMFGSQLKNVWFSSNVEDLEEKVKERDKIAMQLEGAETKLIKLSNDARLKMIKKGTEHPGEVDARELDGESGSMAAKWVPTKKRPTHKLKPIIGKKVDTINWSRAELDRLIPEIDALQNKYRAGDAKYTHAFFVEFYAQSEAQAAYQMVAHHQPLHMSPRYIGLNPNEIIWSNLRITWWERVMRNIGTMAFICALIVFWSIPIGFAGIVSNINYIVEKLPWLSFINDIPSAILGVVTGLLPSIMVAVVMALLPIILRLMARISGVPALSWVELRVQEYYFAFQVVQVFLVTTLTSAATAAIVQIINDPSSVTTLLASSLPKASNFYISYFILQGMSMSSGAILNIVGFALFIVLGKLLDSTPRKMYQRWANLSGLGWGTVYPVWTNLCVIAITYAAIAPLVLGFATLGLFFVYFAYRYNLLFVASVNIDTKGVAYARALQQTLTGCYLSMVCLIGLFGIAGAVGPIILMVIYLIFFALFHVSLNGALGPLLFYLPKSLEAEEEALLASGEMEEGLLGEPQETNGKTSTTTDGVQRTSSDDRTMVAKTETPVKKPNMFQKWLRPDVYTDYKTLRKLVPRNFYDISYAPEVERDAYYHPSITSPTPLLWIPRDEGGVSTQEVRHTSKVIPITDEGAFFNEKGKIVWDEEGLEGRPPIYEEKIYY
ncbi:MAG: hypothetical protein M1834_007874 [Cirrosporium novae-zelandiae]|nr:MAG: hypothetical protein M1834_007874 [Cirrosporium novae-zelandiae]